MDIQTAPKLPEKIEERVLMGEGLPVLFELQLELMAEYVKVEKLPQWPINPHEPKNQVILKDFMGRVAEELGESWEYYENMREGKITIANLSGFNEEIADVTAFLLETLIYVGVTPEELHKAIEPDKDDALGYLYNNTNFRSRTTIPRNLHEGRDYIEAGIGRFMYTSEYSNHLAKTFWHFNYLLQMSKNVLKNKPWKVHQVMTDENKFRNKLLTAAVEFFRMTTRELEMSPLGLVTVYYKKNRVNLFRIKSKY